MTELPFTLPAWLGPVGLLIVGLTLIAQIVLTIDTLVTIHLDKHRAAALATPVREHDDLEADIAATVEQAQAYLNDRPYNWAEEGL